MRIGRWAFLPVLVCALAGCGGDDVKMAEVVGTIKLNGEPLNEVQVEFWPMQAGPRSIAVTDSSGRFTLMSDNGLKKGASVGTHKIVLHDISVFGGEFLGRAGEDADMAKGRKPRISTEYTDANITPLTGQVEAGKKNEIDLDVKPWKAP